MVCLMLVLAPVMCILASIAVSSSLSTYMKYLDSSSAAGSSTVQPKDAKSIKVEAVLKVKDQVRYMVLGKRIH
jgi:dolichyl-diphosphooligosaccharide--protein glycosyltransferase